MYETKLITSISVHLDHVGDCCLPVFANPTVSRDASSAPRSAVVYGRNGTGKSSIARALGTLPLQATFSDRRGKPLTEAPGDHNVFVFDEQFIDRQFRQVGSENLQPIVLLGEAVENLERMEQLQQEIGQGQSALDNMAEDLDKKTARVDRLASTIKGALRGKNSTTGASWSDRSMQYNEDGQRRNVTERVFTKVVHGTGLDGDATMEALERSFTEHVTHLAAAREHGEIMWTAPTVKCPVDLSDIETAIHGVDARPVGTATSKVEVRLRSVADGRHQLAERVAQFNEPDVTFCPHCLQSLSPEHKVAFAAAVQAYTAELEASSAIADLRTRRFDWRPMITPPSQEFGDHQLITDVQDRQREVVEACELANARIDAKCNNPASAVTVTDIDLSGAVTRLIEAVTALAQAIETHNAKYRGLRRLRDAAEEINLQMAAVELQDMVREYRTAETAREKKRERYSQQDAKVHALRQELASLKVQARSETEAAREINRLLAIVFGSDGLKLVAEEAGYVASNRAANVSPGRLSTGERNALSLCYFFVQIAAGKRRSEMFRGHNLVVLDDPVSSFDYDNRYGVLSLISFMAWGMLGTESETKLLVMTHDPSVAYELSKSLAGITRNVDWELRENCLQESKFASVDSYGETLDRMYQCAMRQVPPSTLPDRNAVRRVMEGFATFELGENVTDFMTKPKIREIFTRLGDSHESFLNSIPARVFIHPDSHANSHVRFQDYYLLPSMDDQEFCRFVRDLLCFMHVVAPNHIPSRIGKDQDTATKVRKQLDDAVNEVLDTLQPC